MRGLYKIIGGLLLLVGIAFYVLVYPQAKESFEQFQKDTIPVLAYHQIADYSFSPYTVTKHEFEKHMRYLHEQGYQTVNMVELRDLLEEKRLGKETKLGTQKYIVLTFDDGYKDNLENATPILQKYGFKASIYIITGFVNRHEFLTAAQIKTMRVLGWEIGSHGDTHIELGKQKQSVVAKEGFYSKRYLEYSTRQLVHFLAYPFGSYNKETAQTLGEIGYWGALTGINGVNTVDTDPWEYRRVNLPQDYIVNTMPMRLFKAQFVDWVRYLWKDYQQNKKGTVQ